MRAILFGLSTLILVFSGLISGYFFWKYIVLYLPNQAEIDACVPSGGSCSINDFANLEVSLPSALIFTFIAFFSLSAMIWLIRPQSRNDKTV